MPGFPPSCFTSWRFVCWGNSRAQLQLICCTVFKLSRDSVGPNLHLPAGKGALAPVEAPFRGALPSAWVQQKQPTWTSDHSKEGTGAPQKWTQNIKKRRWVPLINNKAKITSVATVDKDVTKKRKPLFNLRNVEVKISKYSWLAFHSLVHKQISHRDQIGFT